MSQRYSTVTLSSDMEWDDGVKFTGYLVFQVVMPAQAQLTGTNGNIISGSPTLADSQPSVFVPLWHVIPVVNGQLSSNARIWKNSAYNPRGTKYKLFAFDAYMTQLTVTGISAGLFAVTSDTYTLTLSPVSTVYTDGTASSIQVGVQSYSVYSGGISGTASVTRRTVTLAANTTISQTVEAAGNLLSVVVDQNATGGWTLGWSSDFSIPATFPFDNSPNARSTYLFVSDGTYWVFMAGNASGA